ncbi:serine/threonine-protein kinase [Actinoplanes derwentensis]|uniref:non-specific serine/threonine protein kinase n=1 Tax=Actinoplanes derwentensis TaxID=113562 RepID=A0A1H2D5P2_9ACTN|nr:serine/threonine-protein kinase [Actinoplanes derwentensis]GID85329.1 hypothetical protein Ade03nite_42530 [Actinoplanes derwentensis]SDT77914.1 Serine/threonine protein kinase [Actinoplanes derwentensis]
MTVRQRLVAGRYRLREPVGAGGMGRVWLARDEMLHRDVAVKEIVPPDWMTDAEQARLRQRTLREARSAARLNHPHVVRIYDVVHADGLSWIVMEYVPSRSLHQVLQEDGPYEPVVAARIGLAVLDALAAAHRAGVLHRDVKPHNVLIGTDGRVVLTDFGLATYVDDGTVTAPGLIVGSPQYVSPERGLDGASTVESDLWSLGATLYAAVEGRSPYARETAMATLAALATEPPDPPVRAGPLTPILGGLLRYEPADRLTAPEVERRLRMIVVADPREIPPLPTQRTPRSAAAAEPRPPVPKASGPSRPKRAAAVPTDPPVAPEPPVAPFMRAAPERPVAESWSDGSTVTDMPVEPEPRSVSGQAPVRRPGPEPGVEPGPGPELEPEPEPELEPEPPAGAGAGTGVGSGGGTGTGTGSVSEEPASSAAPEPEIISPNRSGGQEMVLASPKPGPIISGQIVKPSRLSRLGRARIRVTRARLSATGLVVLLLGGSLLAGYVTELNDPSPQVFLPAPLSASAAESAEPAGSSPPVSGDPADSAGSPGMPSPRPGTPQPPVGLPGMPAETTPPHSASPDATLSGPQSPGPISSGPLSQGANSPGMQSPGTLSQGANPPGTQSPGVVSSGSVPPGAGTGQRRLPAATPTPGSASEKATSRAVAYSPVRCDSARPAGLPRTPQRGAARGVKGLTLQAGWSYFNDGSGFHIAVPDGWTYQRVGSTYCFRSPRSARVMSFDTGRDPAADPLTAFQDDERRIARSGNPPGYALIGIASVPLLNKAADWEFRYRSPAGGSRHASVRWFVSNGRAYTLGWSTPSKTWKSDLLKIQMIRGTFYASRTTSTPPP